MRVMFFLRMVLKKTMSFESSRSKAWSLGISLSKSKKFFNGISRGKGGDYPKNST